MSFPRATTAVYALLGRPVQHSKSPQLHNAVFDHLGIDAVYVAHEIDKIGPAVAALRQLGYAGANVTMPFKTEVVDHVDVLGDAAREMRAVNTLTFRDGLITGDNTDGAGLFNEIRRAGTHVAGAKVVLLGTGGAAAAIWTQAALDGVASVKVFNRAKPGLDEIAHRLASLSERSGCDLTLGDLAEREVLAAAVDEADIVVNATAVGMGELAGQSLIERDWISPHHTIADAVYHPRLTKLLEDAREAGARTVEGIRMLLGQAAVCEKIWLGIDMPFEVASAAVNS